MSKRPVRRLSRYVADADYPSLDEHRAARRRFLAGGAVVLGAGALATACGRPFWSDEQQLDGAQEQPDYYTVRFPVSDDRAVYLMDGGYARFYAVAMTWHEDCHLFAVDAREQLTDLFADDLAGRTVDELSTATGVDAVASQLCAQLNAAYEQDTGEVPGDWFHDLELVLTQLDPGELMGGVPVSPSYP